jgi:hypothetical protein
MQQLMLLMNAFALHEEHLYHLTITGLCLAYMCLKAGICYMSALAFFMVSAWSY